MNDMNPGDPPMTLQQMRRYMLTCDGYTERGQPCPTQINLEAIDRPAAEAAARAEGWTEANLGWNCPWTHSG